MWVCTTQLYLYHHQLIVVTLYQSPPSQRNWGREGGLSLDRESFLCDHTTQSLHNTAKKAYFLASAFSPSSSYLNSMMESLLLFLSLLKGPLCSQSSSSSSSSPVSYSRQNKLAPTWKYCPSSLSLSPLLSPLSPYSTPLSLSAALGVPHTVCPLS